MEPQASEQEGPALCGVWIDECLRRRAVLSWLQSMVPEQVNLWHRHKTASKRPALPSPPVEVLPLLAALPLQADGEWANESGNSAITVGDIGDGSRQALQAAMEREYNWLWAVLERLLMLGGDQAYDSDSTRDALLNSSIAPDARWSMSLLQFWSAPEFSLDAFLDGTLAADAVSNQDHRLALTLLPVPVPAPSIGAEEKSTSITPAMSAIGANGP